jgi:hypothetical protein
MLKLGIDPIYLEIQQSGEEFLEQGQQTFYR